MIASMACRVARQRLVEAGGELRWRVRRRNSVVAPPGLRRSTPRRHATNFAANVARRIRLDLGENPRRRAVSCPVSRVAVSVMNEPVSGRSRIFFVRVRSIAR